MVLGEFALIERLKPYLTTTDQVILGAGDDCAILRWDDEYVLLATVDAQVEGVHFTLRTSTPEQIGRKALAVNLSDIASKGGQPLWALISLVLPSHISPEQIEGIYAGLRQEASSYQIALVGGNISGAGSGKQLIIDITVMGKARADRVPLRSAARVGDIIAVSGPLGDAAAGLATLHDPREGYDAHDLRTVQQRLLTPTPEIRLGQKLATLPIGAMMDLSDGLSGDLTHLCDASKVGAELDEEKLPISPEVRRVAELHEKDPILWALHGGEDYRLLFTVPEDFYPAVRRALFEEQFPCVEIGRIVASEYGLRLNTLDGKQTHILSESWDHLK